MKTNTERPSAARKIVAGKVRLGVGLVAIAIGATGPSRAGSASANVGKGSEEGRSQAQVGTASWYGGRFNGRRTASGERFDMNAFTCAHRTLPLGSWLRVTNLSNLKSIFLRVNDRGPVPRSRVVDLSRGAARMLGIAGLAKVKIQPIRNGDTRMADDLSADKLGDLFRVPLPRARISVLPAASLLVAAR